MKKIAALLAAPVIAGSLVTGCSSNHSATHAAATSTNHRARTAPAQTPSGFQGDISGPWHFNATKVTYITARQATHETLESSFPAGEPVAKIEYWYHSDARIPITVTSDGVIDSQGREFDPSAGAIANKSIIPTTDVLNPGMNGYGNLYLSVPQGDHVKLLRTTAYGPGGFTDDQGTVTTPLNG
jgi:hypothetical protein